MPQPIPGPSVPADSTSLAQVADVRSSPTDDLTSRAAYLFRDVPDDVLLTALAAASRKVEGLAGSTLLGGTWTETVLFRQEMQAGTFGWVGWVGRSPVRREEMWDGTLTSITTLDSAYVTQTVDITVKQFTPRIGRVRLPQSALSPFGPTVPISTEVTYSGVFTTVPVDLIEVTILVAADTFIATTEAPRDIVDPQELWARINTTLASWQNARVPAIA